MKPIKVDPIELSKKLPKPLQLKALTKALDVFVPFNFGLGIDIIKLTSEEVVLRAPDKRKRRNHVGSANAAFLALLSEYPAGLMVAQHYPFDQYRVIISELKVQYFKQGRGVLTSTAKAPVQWPEIHDGEAFLDMQTIITNDKNEQISICHTRWQIKEWNKVRIKKEQSKT